ncbi:MAG TPA: hypothetical protein VLB51_02980 [Methylomirabilota bacterium]|nr:hypothetical protein [Methylomirabilota bacterium]
MRRLVISVIAVCLVSVPAIAQEMLDMQVFPVVARGPGLVGTVWVTDLVVTNPMDQPVTVGMQFLPERQDNMFNPMFPDRVTLAPGETVIAEDVLQSMFGYDDAVKGALALVCDPAYLVGNPEGAVILAVTRTYNVGSDLGTFGQTVPSLVINVNVGWASSFITGARNDADFRSNLGIAGTSPTAPMTVHYRIKDSSGLPLAEDTKTIRVASMQQWSFEQLGVGEVDGPLTVELWLDPASAAQDPCTQDFPNGFFAYVSKVDNGTGDAEFLVASAMEPFYCGVMPDDE